MQITWELWRDCSMQHKSLTKSHVKWKTRVWSISILHTSVWNFAHGMLLNSSASTSVDLSSLILAACLINSSSVAQNGSFSKPVLCRARSMEKLTGISWKYRLDELAQLIAGMIPTLSASNHLCSYSFHMNFFFLFYSVLSISILRNNLCANGGA